MREGAPVLKKENLLYIREEKGGYYTVISKLHPEQRELVVNPTAWEILKLCDGENSYSEIIKK